ncbi:MAG: HNH endonuclease [Proteobacteria bacterium]|nr:HNH endonuclease [Pseudomonadota bacterium]
MRPVKRGASPQTGNFADYAEAKPYLISRLGSYCSYCERRINTHLAVEHIQPKSLDTYKHLEGNWNNFLLACGICNPTKGVKNVNLAEILLPDRDNTFFSFKYTPDGKVQPTEGISDKLAKKAADTLALTGLDKAINEVFNENGKLIAIDRVSQRMQEWLLAEDTKADINKDPTNQALLKSAVNIVLATGLFSIWMTVFQDDTDMLNRLIDAFPGTRASGCFDAKGKTISPAPNPDLLPDGGKI